VALMFFLPMASKTVSWAFWTSKGESCRHQTFPWLSRTPFEKKTFWTQMLKLSMNRRTLFSTHFHLETWYFQETWRNLFHTSHSLRKGLLLPLHPCKLKAFPQTQTPFFHTPQTFNESKNSLPHTFTLKLDTFKNLKNLQNLEEISSTPLTHLEMDLYSLRNLAN
jgi:hypothetical protein